jgi:hypothetical protein
MKSQTRDFLLYCKTMDFGKIEFSKKESAFYRRFNNEIVSLCRTLPQSVQTDAMLFLMQYSRLNFVDMDFFANYYPPAWSILYWLGYGSAVPAQRLRKRDVTNAVTAHAMAMFLHSLDDHLIDKQVPVSPLLLLLRSQAWTIMHRACLNLAGGVPAGKSTVRRFTGEYYSSIQDANGPESLDSYCSRFRSQMAIGMIAPVLLSRKMTGFSDFTRDIERACGSFGVAWRLLDDVKDIAEDIEKGSHSAIYLCLPEKLTSKWDNNTRTSRAAAKDSTKAILGHIMEHRLIDRIRQRIWAELEAAASLVEAHGVTGLAGEFRCLAYPLRNSANSREEDNGRVGLSGIPSTPLSSHLPAR